LQSAFDCHKFSGHGGDDDFVWLSSGVQAVSEGFEDRIVIACDESCLKHHVPQQSSSTTNGPFASHRAAVVCYRSKTC